MVELKQLQSVSSRILKASLVMLLSATVLCGSSSDVCFAKSAKCGKQQQSAIVVVPEQRNATVWYNGKVTVKASPMVVWNSVHEERNHDPDLEYSKIVSHGENSLVLEQKFCFLPVIGSATCVTSHTETPFKRIDYKLVNSDRFKALEGSWILTPSEDGHSTVLELQSHMDMGFPVPRPIMNTIATKKMERRLAKIRQLAESAQVADKSNTDTR